jgi:hypothetical protein
MTLSAENKAYLDELRDRIKRKHVEYNEDDLLKLSSVYGQVLEFSGIKGGGKIDKSCSSCIMEPVKILFNYITYHEPVTPVHRATIVKEVKPLRTVDEITKALKDAPVNKVGGIPGYIEAEKTAPVVEFVDNNDGITGINFVEPSQSTSGLPFVALKEQAQYAQPPVKKTRRPRTVKPKK